MLTSVLMIFIATDLLVFMMWLTDISAPQNKSRLAWWVLVLTACTVVIMVAIEQLVFPANHPGLTYHSGIAFILAAAYVLAVVKVFRFFKNRFQGKNHQN